MKARISFDSPRDVGPNDLDGVVLRFPFTLQTIHEGAEKDTISNHAIDVQISGTLQTMWGLGDTIDPLENQALLRTLFEHARREVISGATSGNLQKHLKINLHIGNSSKSNPFDPAKIPDPVGFSVEIPQLRRIGF